jgi:site-specific DNA recombinase
MGMENRTRAVAYLRVSTDKQAERGVSLEAQEAKVRAYADLYDLELVAVVVDAGVSAKTLDRPGLQRAMAMLDAGEADGLLVTKLDRLSRSVGDWAILIDRYFGEKAARLLFSVGDSIDTRTAAGRLVLNVLMSVHQWEREAIGERTRSAMQHKKGKGERVGSIPYGFSLSEDGVALVEVEAEQAVLQEARTLRDAGLSLRGIATELDRFGLRSRAGRRFDPKQVARMVA